MGNRWHSNLAEQIDAVNPFNWKFSFGCILLYNVRYDAELDPLHGVRGWVEHEDS